MVTETKKIKNKIKTLEERIEINHVKIDENNKEKDKITKTIIDKTGLGINTEEDINALDELKTVFKKLNTSIKRDNTNLQKYKDTLYYTEY